MTVKIKHLALLVLFLAISALSVSVVNSATTSNSTVQTQRRIDPCAGKTCGCGALPACKQTAVPETENKVKPEIKGYFSCDKDPKALWSATINQKKVERTCEFKVTGAQNPSIYKLRTMSKCIDFVNGKYSSNNCQASATSKNFTANQARTLVAYPLLGGRLSTAKCYVTKTENNKERVILKMDNQACYGKEFVIPE